MTWLGCFIIAIEVWAGLRAAGDNKLEPLHRVLTVAIAAALIVGILVVGTGHL